MKFTATIRSKSPVRTQKQLQQTSNTYHNENQNPATTSKNSKLRRITKKPRDFLKRILKTNDSSLHNSKIKLSFKYKKRVKKVAKDMVNFTNGGDNQNNQKIATNNLQNTDSQGQQNGNGKKNRKNKSSANNNSKNMKNMNSDQQKKDGNGGGGRASSSNSDKPQLTTLSTATNPSIQNNNNNHQQNGHSFITSEITYNNSTNNIIQSNLTTNSSDDESTPNQYNTNGSLTPLTVPQTTNDPSEHSHQILHQNGFTNHSNSIANNPPATASASTANSLTISDGTNSFTNGSSTNSNSHHTSSISINVNENDNISALDSGIGSNNLTTLDVSTASSSTATMATNINNNNKRAKPDEENIISAISSKSKKFNSSNIDGDNQSSSNSNGKYFNLNHLPNIGLTKASDLSITEQQELEKLEFPTIFTLRERNTRQKNINQTSDANNNPSKIYSNQELKIYREKIPKMDQPMEWKFSQIKGTLEEEVNEPDIISTVQFNEDGDLLATGDKGGRIVIFKRDNNISSEYNVYSTFQSHEPEFDYLKSLEIEEKINKLRCKYLLDLFYSFLNFGPKIMLF